MPTLPYSPLPSSPPPAQPSSQPSEPLTPSKANYVPSLPTLFYPLSPTQSHSLPSFSFIKPPFPPDRSLPLPSVHQPHHVACDTRQPQPSQCSLSASLSPRLDSLQPRLSTRYETNELLFPGTPLLTVLLRAW
ncbi:hypothetical protein LY76DRAFT_351943 [Colletotrichum caudatum]|nr:hypothetical protein LY76DRAFT_351943 [Colletotrichum caudatum]